MSIIECDRCHGTTINNERCKRRTCKYGIYCFQHAKSMYGLKLGQSNIAGANIGLFATKDIQNNKNIIEYTGLIRSHDDFNTNPSPYGVHLNNTTVLDARSTQSSIARYANDCRAINKRNGECRGNNARLTNAHNNRINLRSTKNIRAGQEIFASYGREYWQ